MPSSSSEEVRNEAGDSPPTELKDEERREIFASRQKLSMFTELYVLYIYVQAHDVYSHIYIVYVYHAKRLGHYNISICRCSR